MRTSTYIHTRTSSAVRWAERHPTVKQSKRKEELQLCSVLSIKRPSLPHGQPEAQALGLCVPISKLELSIFSVPSKEMMGG